MEKQDQQKEIGTRKESRVFSRYYREKWGSRQRRWILLEDAVEAEVLIPPLARLTDDLPRPLR
jgi:hypothetical protein